MCTVCGSIPCLLRCPNATEPKSVFTCACCGGDIFRGEKYINIDGVIMCNTCFEEMPSEEIINKCGYYLQIADN